MKTADFKRTYRSSLIAGHSPWKEVNNGHSETVPDQSYTVREILTKFAQGNLPDIYSEPEFNEGMPDLRGLDYVQLMEMREENKQRVSALEKQKKAAERLKDMPVKDILNDNPVPVPEKPVNEE